MSAAADSGSPAARAAADAARASLAAPPPPPPGQLVWFARVLVAFSRREAQTATGYRVAFLVRGFSFGLSVLAFAFLSRLVSASASPHLARYGGDYLAFAVIGLVLMDFQQVGVSNLSQRIRLAQVLGYLEAELATPAPAWIVLSVGPLYEFALAIIRSTVYFVLARLVFGVAFTHVSVPSLLVAAPLVTTAFIGLGLLAAATTMMVRRTNPVAVLLGSASLLLSGVVYPTSVLPAPLQVMGRFLPMTHAVELARGALLRGAPPSELATSILTLAIFAAVTVPAGMALFVLALRRARADGSLTHY